MRWPWRYKYQALIIGRESGNRSSLPFVRFRRADEAMAWCIRMNDAQNTQADSLTYYAFEVIKK